MGLCRLAVRCICCCCAVPLFLFSVYCFLLIRSISFRNERSVILGPFNDGGCELLAEDLIRGGGSVKLWKDGVAIVSAGDFNTTHRHYARGARGVGLFAVDLNASPRPTVRKLELLDWPKGVPELVGQGLFISNRSGRLYVVNHNHKDEQEPLEERDYEVDDLVQGLCCCCGDGRAKYFGGQIVENLGGGTYLVEWDDWEWRLRFNGTRRDIMLARQLRPIEIASRHSRLSLEDDPSCPNRRQGPFAASEKLSEEECESAEGEEFGNVTRGFVQFLEDEPAGCYLRGGLRFFNLHPNGSRRVGRRSICKLIDLVEANEWKISVGMGEEEELPESSVEVFEILGNDFRSLRLRHVDRVTSDYFPYQGITQVLEGRSSEELFLLRELPWRSTPSEHNAVEGSRNNFLTIFFSPWRLSALFWWLRCLGMPTVAKNQVWMFRNRIRLSGGGPRHFNFGNNAGYRFTDTVSTKGADVTVLRCTRLQPHGLHLEGLPVLGGLRWNCSRTIAYGLPMAKGFSINPNRTDLLLGTSSFVIRYKIQDDGELKEVGVTNLGAKQGMVSGLNWEEADKILYSLLPVPSLMPYYRMRMFNGPGPPWELAVGEPPAEGRIGWLANILAVFGPSSPMPLLMRHDGSLVGHTTSWTHHAGAVLVGSEYAGGLLYCPKVRPLAAPEFHTGDRVLAEKSSLGSQLGLHDLLLRVHLVTPAFMFWFTMSAYMTPSWHVATVVKSTGSGIHVAPDEDPTTIVQLTAERLWPLVSARRYLHRDEQLYAQDASGQWKRAMVVEDHGDGNVTIIWDDEVVPAFFMRRREADDEIHVEFSPAGSSIVQGRTSPESSATREGSCSAEAASNTSSCPSLVPSSAPGSAEEKPDWELEVADGFYEVTLIFRRKGSARAKGCSVEGHNVEGMGSILVEVRDGKLTLGGCSGLLQSLVIRVRPEEEALATPFFHGPIGSSSIGHFETCIAVENEEGGFLRRLPAGLTAENTTIVATVRGGSCGARATLRFQVDEKTLRYFQHGERAGWRPLREVRELMAPRVAAKPERIFTGDALGNEGWSLDAGNILQTFASNVRNNRSFHHCNSQRLTGGETVTLSYLAGPPRISREIHPPLKAGDLAEAFNPVTMNMTNVRITRRNADGTFVVERLDGADPNMTVKERRLPIWRLRRLYAGFRRHGAFNRPSVCEGHPSWTWNADSEADCLSQCAARPLCRFVAFHAAPGLAKMYPNCHTSTQCSETFAWGGHDRVFSVIYEKVDPEV